MTKKWFGQAMGSRVLTCGASSIKIDHKAGDPLFLDNFFDAVKRIVGGGSSAEDMFTSGRGNRMTGAAV